MHLYIHIPFCRQACHYCDFHFSTNTSQQDAIVNAIVAELVLRKDYLSDKKVDTIYFGGGTPSLLTSAQLDLLLNAVYKHFEVDPEAEITLEANPDDLDQTKINQLQAAGINRLSIGLQSFDQNHLQFLNRIHSSTESIQCVSRAKEAGIDNISIDLIYAIPAPDHSILRSDLEQAARLDVSHISAYCLTIEPQTVFGNWLKKKQIKPIDEEFAASQFEILIATLAAQGYEHYEISNFARNDQYSRHNSAYWKQRSYLGIGPSAHSYDGESRQYNVANNAQYLKAIAQNEIPCTLEILTSEDQTNEYLLTGLRTKWGVDLQKLADLSKGQFNAANALQLDTFNKKGWIREDSGSILLTEAGKLFADRIASDLFIG